jgi:hypothetical protein
MPIVRKLEDLEQFVFDLMDKGYKDIGLHTLRREIAKTFGISEYVIRNIMRRLAEFNLIIEDGPQRFLLKDPYIDEKRKTREAEKEAEKEIFDRFGC